MGSGITKGARDFLLLGDFNVMCAYCGRKRKASEMVQDNEFARKLWCCPEHADQRHPQDFARGIKENMASLFTQPPIIAFAQIGLTFPLSANPNPLLLVAQSEIPLVTETSRLDLTTESGIDLTTEPSNYSAVVLAQIPNWMAPDAGQPGVVYVTSVQWSWASGGAGMLIVSPESLVTQIIATSPLQIGVLQCVVTNSLGAQATVSVPVTV
jgi:hypothetical protein